MATYVAAPHAVDHGRIRTPHSHVRGMPATQKLNTPPAVYECLRTEGMSGIFRGTMMSMHDGMIQWNGGTGCGTECRVFHWSSLVSCMGRHVYQPRSSRVDLALSSLIEIQLGRYRRSPSAISLCDLAFSMAAALWNLVRSGSSFVFHMNMNK